MSEQLKLDLPPLPYCKLDLVTVERDGRKIRCQYWPLLPTRGVDWAAVSDDYDGGETEPVGRGATMEAAIADLLDQMEG